MQQHLPGRFVSPHCFRWTAPLLTLFALGSLARGSVAQDPPLVGTGARVRLTLRGARPPTLIGRLMEVGPDSLTIAGEKALDRRVFHRSAVLRVDISLRQESPQVVKGMAKGAVFGALIAGAFALGVAASTPSCDEPSTTFRWCHKTGKLLAAIGVGAAGGAALGYELTGKHPRDVWTPARLPDGALPLLGLGKVGDHHVLLIGFSFAR